MSKWTPQEVAILKENYSKTTNSQLAVLLPGKSALGIYKKARKMGLYRPPNIEFINRSEWQKGEKGSNWKGGIRKTKKGYRQVLRPDHPRADSSGYVMEHIIVWEDATSLPVPDNCIVHHLNGDKTDNRIENLCIMHRGAHTAFHHTGAKRSEETRRNISKSMRGKRCSTKSNFKEES